MKMLIIEDETPAANQLKRLIGQLEPAAEIAAVIDSIESAVAWLKSYDHPDIVFMDIQLADGLSFKILEAITIDSSVIFTTAFDHYAVKAFRVNGLDYLLKPIDPNELAAAIAKHKNLQQNTALDYQALMQAMTKAQNNPYKERLLIKTGDKYLHIRIPEIAYFYAESGGVYAVSNDGVRHLTDHTLDHLSSNLDPNMFFKINRKVIINIDALQRSIAWFNSRLKLELMPPPSFEVIVSREKVSTFKEWLDR